MYQRPILLTRNKKKIKVLLKDCLQKLTPTELSNASVAGLKSGLESARLFVKINSNLARGNWDERAEKTGGRIFFAPVPIFARSKSEKGAKPY